MRPHWTDLHDGWIVVILGVVVVMCALGIGRYAFGMLLPSMGDGLALSYRQMGVISTSNFVGYLVGAVLSGRLIVRLEARRLIAAGLATIAVSLMIISISSSFWLVLVLFIVTGLWDCQRRHDGPHLTLVPAQPARPSLRPRRLQLWVRTPW